MDDPPRALWRIKMIKSFRLIVTVLALLSVVGCTTTAPVLEDRLRTALKQMDKPSFQHINEQGLTPDGCGFIFLVRDVTWCYATWKSIPLGERMRFLLQEGSPVILGLLEAGRVEALAEELQKSQGGQVRLSLDQAKMGVLAQGDEMFQSCTSIAKGPAEEDLCIFVFAQLASEVETQRALARVASIEAEDGRASKLSRSSRLLIKPMPYRHTPSRIFLDAGGRVRIKR